MQDTHCPVPQTYIFNGPPHADIVSIDNYGGGFIMGKHLGEAGHKRVAFIGPDSLLARERLAGLRSGIELNKGTVPADIVNLKLNRGGQGPTAVDELLAGESRPEVIRKRFTAIMGYNDWFAIHAVARLRQLGLRVHEDVRVVGFDNAIPAWYDGPNITSCSVPLEELGAEAARLLYWRIEHPNAIRRKLTLETTLIEAEPTSDKPTS